MFCISNCNVKWTSLFFHLVKLIPLFSTFLNFSELTVGQKVNIFHSYHFLGNIETLWNLFDLISLMTTFIIQIALIMHEIQVSTKKQNPPKHQSSLSLIISLEKVLFQQYELKVDFCKEGILTLEIESISFHFTSCISP